MTFEPRRDERGIALIMTLLLALLVASMAVGVFLMMGNTSLVAKFHANEAQMKYAADAGLERARDRINGTPSLLPSSGYATLESNVTVTNALGATIPGFTRSTYIGESGDTTGQFGRFASVITEIRNPRGAVVVRRAELKQDPFSRFARFFNTWTCCQWGKTEVVFGPVHSNQGMALQTGAPGATFQGPVTTVGAIGNQSSGNWNAAGSPQTGVAAIPFPTITALTNMQNYATAAGMVITGDATATAPDPDTRIEFVALDLNNDGTIAAEEGFFRVFKATYQGGISAQQRTNRRNYVTGRKFNYYGGTAVPTTAAPFNVAVNSGNDPNLFSPNCGGTPSTSVGAGGIYLNPPFTSWLTADSIWRLPSPPAAGGVTPAQKGEAVRRAFRAPDHQCFAGGDPRLYGSPTAPRYRTMDIGTDNPTTPGGGHFPAGAQWGGADQQSYGRWLSYAPWGGNPPAALIAWLNGFTNTPTGNVPRLAPGENANTVAQTFWPLTRNYNINHRGVIYVTGGVAVSGLLRGRATVVATGDVLMPDDISYVQPPATNCEDILGVITQSDAWVEDNNLNTPFNVTGAFTPRFDDSPNETFNAFFLTLGRFGGQNITAAGEVVVAPENCGGTTRGCKLIIGGTIQQGVSGTFNGTTGWAEQDTYDQCGLLRPPPFYPTTGRFSKYKYYEIDPVGFNVAAWYAANQ